MSAGLPGLGLGGLFFIFSALLAPFPELWRTLRGRSDRGSWRAIGRQLAQALAMIAAIDLTLRLTYVVLSAVGIGNAPAADQATVLPLGLIGITTGLLVFVLCSAKLAELGLRASGAALPRVPDVLPRVAPLRAAAFAAVAVIAWIALLATGASELSPLERPPREQIASRPERDAGAEPRQVAVKPRARGERDRPSIPVATEVAAGGRGGTSGPRRGAAAPGPGGAGAAPSPDVAAPKAPPPKPPPKPAESVPNAQSEPQGPPAGAPATEAPAGAGGRPESPGPPAGVPASEGAGPASEPPPQAPAKGLRDSG